VTKKNWRFLFFASCARINSLSFLRKSTLMPPLGTISDPPIDMIIFSFPLLLLIILRLAQDYTELVERIKIALLSLAAPKHKKLVLRLRSVLDINVNIYLPKKQEVFKQQIIGVSAKLNISFLKMQPNLLLLLANH